MPRTTSTNFRYLPVTSADQAWGLVVNTVGISQIAPGSSYPPAAHPTAYELEWRLGRKLTEYQIGYISEGSGLLELRDTSAELVAGDAFFLRPGVWHRYRPHLVSGWHEHWVGFDGSWIQQIIRVGLISPTCTVLHIPGEVPLRNAFSSLHQLSDSDFPGLQQVLAGYAMTIVGFLFGSTQPKSRRQDSNYVRIQAALSALSEPRLEVELPELAVTLNMSYSTFRRIFKQWLGISPNQFRIHSKLTNSRDLLRSTELSIKQIADLSGFSSEQYFCRLFRRHIGKTPGDFRNSERKLPEQ